MTRTECLLRATALCGSLALAGCATTRVPAPAAAPPVVAADREEGGLYKVGRPYEVEGIWYYPSEDYNYKQEGIASWYGQDFHGKRTANGERYDMNDVTAAHPTLPLPSMVKITNLDNGRVLDVRVNDRGPFHSSRIIDVSRRAAQLLGFYDVGTAHVRVEIDPAESLRLKSLALKDHPPEMPQIAAAPRASISTAALAPVVAKPSDLSTAATIAAASATAPATAAMPAPVVAKPATAAKSAPKSTPKAVAKAPAKSAPAPMALAKTPAKAIPSAGVGGIFIQAGAFSDIANAHRLEKQLKELGNTLVLPVTVNNTVFYRVRLGPLSDDSTDALLTRVKSFGYEDAQIIRY